MKKTLRPYQKDALDELLAKLKESKEPSLVVASVGAGKSLIIAELLLIIEKANYRALCLTLNSDLIRQNVATYIGQGGHASIYCAALDEKDYSQPIVFASPHSIHNGIKNDKALQDLRFNIIIIDEAHNVNTNDKKSMYMRLLNHYGHLAQAEQYSYRVVGLTGTPFRGKGFEIVGERCFFKHRIADITTSWLIDNHYLVDPHFGLPAGEAYDFSKLKIMSTGKFDGKQLQQAIDQQQRLTAKIMQEVVKTVSKRNGAFIFASTVKHCEECLRELPADESAMITGETPSEERNRILNLARKGFIKYLVNVNVLTVGIDVPNFDTVVFVRPTESLVLYTQAIGRGLRLHDSKTDCLIFDYAGNLERHGDLNDPIINRALNEWANDNKEYCIPCFDCGTMNTMHARRCIGMLHKSNKRPITQDELQENKSLKDFDRCDHFFEFKECLHCHAKNDKVSRHCWRCKEELIDPNQNLTATSSSLDKTVFKVLRATYNLRTLPNGNSFIFSVFYTAVNAEEAGQAVYETTRINETYVLSSEGAKNVFYHKFLKKHYDEYTKCYLPLKHDKWDFFKDLVKSNTLKTPNEIDCVPKNGYWHVTIKHFLGEEVPQSTERTVRVLATSFKPLETPKPAKSLWGLKIEITYYCVDEKENMFSVKDKYVMNSKADSRLLKDYPDLYREIYMIKDREKVLEFLRTYQAGVKIKSPESLVINAHGNIIKWIGSIQHKGTNCGDVLNVHLEQPGWRVIDVPDGERGVDSCIIAWKTPQNDYMVARAFVRSHIGMKDLFKNHQVKEVVVHKRSKYSLSIAQVILIDGQTIQGNYDH